MADQLKACAHCGCGNPEFTSDAVHHFRHTIKCQDCPMRAEFYSSTRDQAIAAWNRRSEPVGVPTVQAEMNWHIELRTAHSKWSTTNTPKRESAAFEDGFDAAMRLYAAPSQPVSDHTEQHLAMVPSDEQAASIFKEVMQHYTIGAGGIHVFELPDELYERVKLFGTTADAGKDAQDQRDEAGEGDNAWFNDSDMGAR